MIIRDDKGDYDLKDNALLYSMRWLRILMMYAGLEATHLYPRPAPRVGSVTVVPASILHVVCAGLRFLGGCGLTSRQDATTCKLRPATLGMSLMSFGTSPSGVYATFLSPPISKYSHLSMNLLTLRVVTPKPLPRRCVPGHSRRLYKEQNLQSRQ